MMHASRYRRLLVASLAGALAAPTALSAHEESKVSCYGVNKCKGMGACGGKGTACAGTNSCKRQGFLEMDKETCLKVDGGRLTADAEKPAEPKKDPKKPEKK
jgi:uncharacterized membrane protein